MKTLEIDISSNKKEVIEQLFIDHEVYEDTLIQRGNQFGYIRSCTTGGSEPFYFIRGVKVEGGIKHLATGEIIELA